MDIECEKCEHRKRAGFWIIHSAHAEEWVSCSDCLSEKRKESAYVIKPLFTRGDIVTYKEEYTTPIGEVKHENFTLVPYEVINVLPDDRADERTGEEGSAHQYILKNLITDKEIRVFQYELARYKDRRDDILGSLIQRLSFLQQIGNLK